LSQETKYKNEMKRFVLSFQILLVALTSMAQGFQFMGIPLEGNSSHLNQEMLKNGFTRSNPGQNDGTNIYKGSFEGEPAIAFVLYDTQTDFVFRAVALITRPSKDLILEIYQTMHGLIEARYVHSEGVKVLVEKKEKFDSLMHGRAKNPYEWKSITQQNGYEATTLMIPDPVGNILGDITIFVNESPSRDSQSTVYNLYIQYTVWKAETPSLRN
jgi:hypothetical protein